MTEPTSHGQPPRRPWSHSDSSRCQRPTCTRLTRRGKHCSFACRAVHGELEKAQRICEAVGPGKASAQLWASAVTMSDALSEIRSKEAYLKGIARSVGIPDATWLALVTGQAQTQDTPAPAAHPPPAPGQGCGQG